MSSRYDCVWLYDRCDQLAFFEAHVRALAYCGGVPQRSADDHRTPAVRQIVGAERVWTERLAALATQYLFAACFARPGAGHDKGGVESRGKAIRLQHRTPIPAENTLKTIAKATLTEVEAASRTKAHITGQTVWERFQEERPRCRALPAHAVSPGPAPRDCPDGRGHILGPVHVGRADQHSRDWGGGDVPLLAGGDPRVRDTTARGTSHHVPA